MAAVPLRSNVIFDTFDFAITAFLRHLVSHLNIKLASRPACSMQACKLHAVVLHGNGTYEGRSSACLFQLQVPTS